MYFDLACNTLSVSVYPRRDRRVVDTQIVLRGFPYVIELSIDEVAITTG